MVSLVVPATRVAEAGGSLEPTVGDQPGQVSKTPSLKAKAKITQYSFLELPFRDSFYFSLTSKLSDLSFFSKHDILLLINFLPSSFL